MKPAPFAYEAPRTVDAALALLGDDAKVLAGGQSLVPIMNFRLARPATLVDVNRHRRARLPAHSATASLHIGALTRHATLERSELVARGWPLLRQAVRHVGHPQIRSRGTVGGSCAHADPTAELPVALTALDARFHAAARARDGACSGRAEFFLSHLTTALRDDELLVEIEVPPLPAGARTRVRRARAHARRLGDRRRRGRACAPRHAAIALLGAGPTPRARRRDAEARARRRRRRGRGRARSRARSSTTTGARALTTALVRRALEEAGRVRIARRRQRAPARGGCRAAHAAVGLPPPRPRADRHARRLRARRLRRVHGAGRRRARARRA